ncbi:PREDICTED: T-cell-interacting, activating receptor on myeloid cells protein 1 isoform X3 [Hipposideros armiger]|uniref:T-cell-interacting, activating receptor on myeloid cells protein 1 isoform X3 n=1 Tax=Hipposideros armiger TaxID=186990 RepID=UPI00093E3169|nr:PREDICTED: T-cell-interacting, activating receptor on myeloid cells protein 1 isoform X3 [Hipposideros armiger]
MIPPFLALFCVGLCAGQGDIRRHESLPRPSISAWPSSVVPANSTVTLRCSAPTRDGNFALRKNGFPQGFVPSPDSPEGLAEFHLADLKNSNAGEYTCEYYRRESPHIRSPPSDALLLLVTGNFPKPLLQPHQRGKVTAGGKVTLQCQRPEHLTESIMFALLKKGTSTPIQIQNPVGKETDFSLQNVAVDDTGDYSCVYFQGKPPFWASEPSNHLAIWVTARDSLLEDTESSNRAETTLGTTEIILIIIFTLLFLLAAFLIYRYSNCGAALDKMTKSSHSSKKPEEVVTDVSPAVKSCSLALEEGTQGSRAEEPHGVTYAELNTRALSEGPSSQEKQPLETCVYSALKM